MKLLTYFFAAALALALSVLAAGQAQQAGAEPQAATRTSQASQQAGRDGELSVPRIDRDVSLNDFNEMKPSAWAAEHMSHAGSFVQNQPFDGKAPTERTDVWMGRTATTFFVAFLCYDHHTATIRGHLSRRENISADDSVGVLLDPFQDRRRGVLFQLNPAGVQADANWTEPGDQDYSYDQVWDSSARRTPGGWMALMAIPFRSIRSRSNAPQWGVVLMRNLPRNSETDYWPRISQSISGTLSQEGSLLGMNGESSHNIQLNPYGIAHRLRQINTNDPLNPFFSNRDLSGTVGGDVKAVVKDTIVLDGTINPDFSQIESDQPQFRVNQRYALFYPELRPFFLENSSYFDTPITLLYTRTIGNPEFGARATGKIRHTNIGFLAIDDRDPGTFVAPNDPLHGKRAFTLAARVSQDIGKFSNVGAIYVQRTLNGSSNRVGGIDFNARIDQHWQLSGMTVVSSTHQLDGSYSAGPATR
ncbi:MAG: carbohydrate binding family 9 domain-containing protein, partial [Janthinobacterium lividum]